MLELMRNNGTALVPRLRVMTGSLAAMQQAPPSARRDWYLAGAGGHAHLVMAAYEAGVEILAGTDDPEISIGDEVRALAMAGMPPERALAAASWSARRFLGLDGFTAGSAADAVVFDSDPRLDLEVLDHPQWVISRGRVLRHPRSAH